MELTRRQQSLAALNGEAVRLRARLQTEQSQVVATTRAVEEARAREAEVLREIAEMERSLGPSVPPRRIPTAQAEEALAALQTSRAEARARAERMTVEARRTREDLDRAAVQLKQLAAERQRAQAALAR